MTATSLSSFAEPPLSYSLAKSPRLNSKSQISGSLSSSDLSEVPWQPLCHQSPNTDSIFPLLLEVSPLVVLALAKVGITNSDSFQRLNLQARDTEAFVTFVLTPHGISEPGSHRQLIDKLNMLVKSGVKLEKLLDLPTRVAEPIWEAGIHGRDDLLRYNITSEKILNDLFDRGLALVKLSDAEIWLGKRRLLKEIQGDGQS